MKGVTFLGVASALLSCFAGATQAVFAEPAGLQVVSGSAELAAPSQTDLIVRQHSQTVRLDWTGFSIHSGETVRFEQPSAPALSQLMQVEAQLAPPRPGAAVVGGVGMARAGFGLDRASQPVTAAAANGAPQIMQATQKAAPADNPLSGSQNSGQENGPASFSAIPGRICVGDSRGQSLCTLR